MNPTANATTTEVILHPIGAACEAEASILEELLWAIPGITTLTVHIAPEAEPGQVNPPVTALSVFTQSPTVLASLTTLLQSEESIQAEGWHVSEVKQVAEADWAEAWKAHWHVMPITEGLVICPSWEAYTPKPGETVIKLDPGAAFGTGTHPTTQLMLKAIHHYAKTHTMAQTAVLDVGTGSGVLAIDAALLGARQILGTDCDEKAIVAAEQNAQMNGVENHIQWTTTDLGELCHTPYDLILANIVAPTIIALLPEIRLRLAPGGQVMLSGLIAKNLPGIEDALAQVSLQVTCREQQGDWFVLVCE